MDVFLVPVAADRYELYCEETDDPGVAGDAEPPKGFLKRMTHRGLGMLAEAERDRHHAETQPPDTPSSFFGRLKARSLRWAAEWVAEQRLLWQLRGKDAVALVHPDDLTDAQARQLLHRSLQRDWERHRFWMVIDSLGLAGSVFLILLPGPNFVGYYFLVRTVGHYFSLRGARQGLRVIAWSLEPSAVLTSLRALAAEACEAREERVQAAATTLRLERFASFFQRSATE